MTCRSISLQTAHDWPKAAKWLEERRNPGDNVESAVRAILDDVRARGDEALLEYTRRFDCAAFEPPLRLSEMDIARSAASVRGSEALAGRTTSQKMVPLSSSGRKAEGRR